MRLAAIGEVMIELAPAGGEEQGPGQIGACLVRGFGGDTFNSAIYMARAGVDTSYVTLLGDDPYSDDLLSLMAAEGIDTSAIQRLPGRSPGLYMIRNSADGERFFHYWRDQAPARELFLREPEREGLFNQLEQMDCLYLSGITLAILSEEARRHLLCFLADYRRNGGRVAFDSNYRPRLWPSPEAARRTLSGFLQQTDIALLTLEDEFALWDDRSAGNCVDRCARYRIGELVLKRGPEPVLLDYDGELSAIPVPTVAEVLDTTGAGDAFNGAYLAARLHGAEPEQAAVAGNRCAGLVIRHRGAIVPMEAYQRMIAAEVPSPRRLVRA